MLVEYRSVFATRKTIHCSGKTLSICVCLHAYVHTYKQACTHACTLCAEVFSFSFRYNPAAIQAVFIPVSRFGTVFSDSIWRGTNEVKSTSSQCLTARSRQGPHKESFRSITDTLLMVILSATLYSDSTTNTSRCWPPGQVHKSICIRFSRRFLPCDGAVTITAPDHKWRRRNYIATPNWLPAVLLIQLLYVVSVI